MQIIFRICLDFFGQFAPMKIGGLSTTDDWFVPHFSSVQNAFYDLLRRFAKPARPKRATAPGAGIGTPTVRDVFATSSHAYRTMVLVPAFAPIESCIQP